MGVNIVNVEVKRILCTIPVFNKSLLHPKAVYKDTKIVTGKTKSIIQSVIYDVHEKIGSGNIHTDDKGEILVSA